MGHPLPLSVLHWYNTVCDISVYSLHIYLLLFNHSLYRIY